MIDRAAELALLGCIPMRYRDTDGGLRPRVVGPRVVSILAAEAAHHSGWAVYVHANLKASHYKPAEWADMQLETVPDETYEAFLEAIRP